MKKINYLTDSEAGKFFTVIVPTYITFKGVYDKFNFKIMSTEPIHIMSGIILALVLYVILTLIQHRNKIKALKEFRDWEMINVINHFNTQLEEFENRIQKLGSKKPKESNNEVLYRKQSQDAKSKAIKEYNDTFKSWGLNDYGIGDKTTLHTEYDYSKKT